MYIYIYVGACSATAKRKLTPCCLIARFIIFTSGRNVVHNYGLNY